MHTIPRLLSQFVPEHYTLAVDIDRKNRQFRASVVLRGTTKPAAQAISLHSKDLVIESVSVDGQAADYSHHEHDELRITGAAAAREGAHTVEVHFRGQISEAMHGMYPCTFRHDGQAKELIATQFESHHAREVFPCVDEPAAKATFDLTLTTEPDVAVLGNMPISSQTRENGRLATTFATTPRMSTYLLAWVVGDLHKKSARTASGIDVNVWATPAQPAENLDFALEVATQTLDFYEQYFDTPYPLPKCDHVALPDFSSGAMENWGLITYRETALLADPATSGPSTKHLIATVIAHELAHQWFGNLVTMEWWDTLWLNESFADFVEHIAVDRFYPEWETWLDFVASRGISALRRDSLDGVQPVEVAVHHPDEITSLFDPSIVYGKGARLMKTLLAFIGEDAFRAGMKEYFKQHAYGNTVGGDLWSCLSTASGKDVGGFMTAWITQPGYPVLTVSENGLAQQRFFIGEHQPSQQQWPILLGAEPRGQLPEVFDTAALDVPVDKNQRFNTNDNGHFITRYPQPHLSALLERVESFPTIDRLTLLHDQTLIVRGGLEPSAALIDLLTHYSHETNDVVWSIISLTLGELKKFVETDETAEQQLKQLYSQVARSQFERLGLDEQSSDTPVDKKLRPIALSCMLYAEDRTAIDGALERFRIDELDQTPGELRPLFISAAVRFSDDPTVVDTLLDAYHQTHSAELREDIASGLTATRDPAVGERLLANCLDASRVRPQDVALWFVYLLQNRYTRDVAWRWLREQWPWIEQTFGGDKSYDLFPRYAGGGLITQQQRDEYADFFTPLRDQPALTRVIDLGLRELDARLELIKRDQAGVIAALGAGK
ncbi:aminopeptidase [Candidatus Saccharibacteria bacterium]|nr:MAG: aminopeptidase [Candidatus Saccharibacteria bacterium]